MRDVFITGAAMTRFGKHLDRPIRSLASESARAALADAGIGVDGIDQVLFANAAGGAVTGQEMIRGQVALLPLRLGGIPIINVENACASSSSALHLASLTVASGAADTVLVVGAEKLTHEDKAVSFAAFNGAVDLETIRERRRARAEVAQTQTVDDQLTGGGKKSTFMDVYADMAKRYMARSGATPEDFARIVVKSRSFGSMNDRAQFRQPTSVEEVLAGRIISDPLTISMCSPIGDGAAALVLSADRSAGNTTVRIRASAVRSNTAEKPQAATRAIAAAYEQAGIGPEDIDVAELHDAAAPAELIYYEELGLCAPDEGPDYLRRGDADLGGRTPVNTSGGLLSRGHPIGATGAGQIVALVDQLSGRAGAAQVEGARIGIAHNAGGTIDGDVGAAVVTILESA